MDDLMQKLQGILNDKESMEQLSQLASMFSSTASGQTEQKAPDLSSLLKNDKPQDSSDSGFDLGTLMALQRAMSLSSKPDNNRELLLALKPLVKEQTRTKIDRLLMIFKILSILPVLKESGILGGELFGGK